MNKASMYGNPFIGIFSKTNDALSLIGKNVSDKFIQNLEVLKTDIIKISVLDGNIIGFYAILNNKGILVSHLASEDEIGLIKKAGNNLGLGFGVIKSKQNAIGNNIAANDFGAIVNSDIEGPEIREIKDVLDVEVVKSTVAGYKTVGAVVVATNKGFIAHPKSSKEELDLMSSLFHVDGGIGTANTGVPFLGISIVANKNGFIVGDLTTGYESGRINDCLGFL
jgi:translation initiation factor 6